MYHFVGDDGASRFFFFQGDELHGLSNPIFGINNTIFKITSADFFQKKGVWHYTQYVSQGVDLREMPNHIFGKYNKNILKCLLIFPACEIVIGL